MDIQSSKNNEDGEKKKIFETILGINMVIQTHHELFLQLWDSIHKLSMQQQLEQEEDQQFQKQVNQMSIDFIIAIQEIDVPFNYLQQDDKIIQDIYEQFFGTNMVLSSFNLIEYTKKKMYFILDFQKISGLTCQYQIYNGEQLLNDIKKISNLCDENKFEQIFKKEEDQFQIIIDIYMKNDCFSFFIYQTQDNIIINNFMMLSYIYYLIQNFFQDQDQTQQSLILMSELQKEAIDTTNIHPSKVFDICQNIGDKIYNYKYTIQQQNNIISALKDDINRNDQDMIELRSSIGRLQNNEKDKNIKLNNLQEENEIWNHLNSQLQSKCAEQTQNCSKMEKTMIQLKQEIQQKDREKDLIHSNFINIQKSQLLCEKQTQNQSQQCSVIQNKQDIDDDDNDDDVFDKLSQYSRTSSVNDAYAFNKNSRNYINVLDFLKPYTFNKIHIPQKFDVDRNKYIKISPNSFIYYDKRKGEQEIDFTRDQPIILFNKNGIVFQFQQIKLNLFVRNFIEDLIYFNSIIDNISVDTEQYKQQLTKFNNYKISFDNLCIYQTQFKINIRKNFGIDGCKIQNVMNKIGFSQRIVKKLDGVDLDNLYFSGLGDQFQITINPKSIEDTKFHIINSKESIRITIFKKEIKYIQLNEDHISLQFSKNNQSKKIYIKLNTSHQINKILIINLLMNMQKQEEQSQHYYVSLEQELQGNKSYMHDDCFLNDAESFLVEKQ